jgi:ADP-heptose:LPS heptosyltransferase
MPKKSNEKSEHTQKGTRRTLGKQPPLYRFFQNPYPDVRFTTCPQCRRKTHLRKFPLVIHIDPMFLMALGKTCRYCTHCDLLIVHQDELEALLAAYFSATNPEMIGNDYLVVGTLDKPEWKKGMQDPLTTQEMLDHLHDFKEAVIFTPQYI